MKILHSLSLVVFIMCSAFSVIANAQQTPQSVVMRAANSLGGVEEIQSIETLRLNAHGQIAYGTGGSNVSGSPNSAQKWINLIGVERVIDLNNWRMSLRQKRVHDFVFARASSMSSGNIRHNVVDNNIAYNIEQDGSNRRLGALQARDLRLQMLTNPISIIRVAMEPESSLSNLRQEDGLEVMALITPWNDNLEIAFNMDSGRPAWVRWSEPHENLGELVNTAYFEAYQLWDGIFMATSHNVVSGWRNISQRKLYIDMIKFNIDTGDLAVPVSVLVAVEPERIMQASAASVAPGIWHITGNGGANSILFEFEDHLTLFEIPSNDDWGKEILRVARETVPGKPVTQVIVSHHHFDHSGGVRQAVAEGLSIITHPDNTGIFTEMTGNQPQEFIDDQGRNPQPLHIIPVEDKLVLEDNSMRVEVYTVVNMNHMPSGVFAYVPESKLLVQADMFDTGWDIMWWGNNYTDNVRYRNLDVEFDVPVHGIVLPYQEVIGQTEQQIRNAQAFCARVEAVDLSMQGCPVTAIPQGMEL